ncbi:helix-turn-helix transcriptional regulator [Flammeovirga aprica]|uniref:HTH luxR-type domain-containing protein n=1 Tax=Flammeovirga aprica JL-4 TaxID=694437 RepID=A0A7X9NZW7_9BACT|nr:LuxR C-terminal-related transcriptional regulator [Flammeovirga aprica]NME66953.1 hypothetical protein [Flammeovirga aprica JL-4]
MIDILDEKHRIHKILYRLTHLAFATTLIYIPLYFFARNYTFIPVQIATASVIGLIFFFIKKQFYVLSGYMLSGVLTLSIGLASYVTPDVSSELLLIPVGVVLTAIFENKKHTVIMFLVVFLSYIFIEEHRLNWEGMVTYSDYFKDIIYHHNIATIFIVSFLIVFHFNRNMKRYVKALKQQNVALEEQQKQIEEQAQELLAEQEKNHELELEFKRKDIEKLNANNQLKVKLQTKAVQTLSDILKSEDIKKELKTVIRELKISNASQQKIQLMQENIDEVNTVFEDRLAGICPTLTKTEREICSFIKLNLSTKEIADIRNTTPNSIRVTKHRIRKKMNIEEEVELESFIQRL